MGFPQGPEHSCGLQLHSQERRLRTQLLPLWSGFLSGLKWQDLLFKEQASPTNHPDSCFKYNCPSGVTCLLRREGY